MEITSIVAILFALLCVVLLFLLWSGRNLWVKEKFGYVEQNASLRQALDTEINNAQSLKQERDELQREKEQIVIENATIKAQNEALFLASQQIKQEITTLQNQSKEQFKNLANEILEDKSQRFTAANRDNMDQILSPLKNQIDGFKKLVEQSYQQEGQERSALKAVVEAMKMANEQITQEAKNLTQALKGDTKTQGCWGEMILESILENSGLTKNEHYFLEHTIRDDQGTVILNDQTDKRMRPDAIVKFPGERVMIIDSKVSLTASARYHEAQTSEQAEIEALSHVRSVKSHIDELRAKNYSQYIAGVEFVMMFIPNESAYILALKTDINIWKYAYQKGIMLVSPNTLVTSLKMCEDLWRQDVRNRNTEEIAKRGGLLYDKLTLFVEDMIKLKSRLDGANAEYASAMSKLSNGQGNLIWQANELRNLGLQTKKIIPQIGAANNAAQLGEEVKPNGVE